MKKRGQFSLEYLLVLAIVIVIVIFSIAMYLNFASPAEEQAEFAEGKKSLEIITQVAFDVYALNEGTQNKVKVRLPGRIEEIRFVDKESYIVFEVADGKTSELAVPSKVNFFDKTFVKPEEGQREFIVGTKTDNLGGLRVCVAFAGEDLDC